MPGTNGAGGGGAITIWRGWFSLLGIGQENFLGFLLFWIGGYALIHGMSKSIFPACSISTLRNMLIMKLRLVYD